MNGVGFCPHKNLFIGLDSHYCPDCHKRFERGTKAYEELLSETLKRDLDRKKDALIERLREEADELYKIIGALRKQIINAKDPSPFKRLSFLKVARYVGGLGFNIVREKSSWVLSMGSILNRKFKNLREIWDLITQEDWHLSDIFPQTSADPPPKQVSPKLPQRHPPLVPSMNASTTAFWRHEEQCLEYQKLGI